MIALAGIGRVFHLAKQRVHLFRLEQASGAHRAMAGHGGRDMHQPAFQRQRFVPFRHMLGEVAQQRTPALALPSSDGVSRTATAPGPKDSIASPNEASSSLRSNSRSTVASSISTISGISRICRCTPFFASEAFNLLVDDALMRGVLVHDNEAVAGLRDDIGFVNLRPRRAERPVEQIGRRLLLEANVRRRRADVEGRLAGFGKAPRGGGFKGRPRPDRKSRRAPPVPIRLPSIGWPWRKSRTERSITVLPVLAAVRSPSRARPSFSACTIKARTSPALRKRTSVLAGWTLASTSLQSSVTNSATTGWRSRGR